MPLITILVEDSPTIRDNLIRAMTELVGLKVVAVAETAAEAMTLLDHHGRWQLAVIDLFLKEGSGLTVVRACQKRNERQHILVLTNYATAEIRRLCIDLGADRVFDKSTELESYFAQCCVYERA